MARTVKQTHALQALLTCPTIAQAARTAGCGEATVRRYLKDAEFAAAYRDGQRQQWHEALVLLTQGTLGAAATLCTVSVDTTQPVQARLKAAIALLEMVHEHLRVADLEERLAALEAAMAAQG